MNHADKKIREKYIYDFLDKLSINNNQRISLEENDAFRRDLKIKGKY